MKKWMALVFVGMIFTLVLAGCGGEDQKNALKDPASFTEEEKFGGTFKARLASDPPTLDPAYMTDTTSGKVADHIFEGLVQYDQDLNVVGLLAKNWEVSENGLEWTFYLKEGVKFHNGREMTAEDVKYSFTRIVDPATQSPRAWIFETVEGAEAFSNGEAEEITGFQAVDNYTFKIVLKESYAPFLINLTMSNATVVPKEAVEEWGEDFTSHPMGTGPFKFVEWMHDDHVTLEAFEDYHEGRPYLDKINFRVIPDDATAFAEYEQGNIHDLDVIADGQIERVVNGDEFAKEFIQLPRLGVYYIGMNLQAKPFDNKLIRQAINHAVNKKLIAEVLRHNTVTPADTIIPPGMPNYDNSDLEGLSYDLEKAKALMAEAGYPNGYPEEIELAYNTSKSHQMIAEAIQSDLKEIGINVKLVNMDWGVYIDKVDNGETQMFRMGWIGDPDPDSFLHVLLNSANFGPAGNGSFYKNEEFDRLTNEARRIADTEKRMEMYHQAEEIVLDDAPWIPLYYYNNMVLRKEFVQNYEVSPIGVMPYKNIWLSNK